MARGNVGLVVLACVCVVLVSARVGSAAPIHDAAKAGNVDEVRRLLDADSGLIGAWDTLQWTPLHYAAHDCRREVVELLIAKGANVNAKDVLGRTPLYVAASHGDKEVVELLIAGGANVDQGDDTNMTPLQWAAWSGDTEIIELLIAHGANVNSRESVGRDIGMGFTPLHSAAAMGRTEAVRLLIAKGADVNAKDKFGRTPRDLAAQNGNEQVVELFIVKGKGDRYGNSPLHVAAQQGDTRAVKVLIANGVDVNARGRSGQTPLHEAALGGRAEITSLLIAHGADVNATDEEDHTPLWQALKGAGPGDTPAERTEREEVAHLLLRSGAEAGQGDLGPFGWISLHCEVSNGHREAVELLIARGADLNAHEHLFGATPLHLAAEQGRSDVVEALLAAGAPADSQDSHKTTPLHWAAKAGRADIAQLLLAHRASVTAKDERDMTPLHEAARAGQAEVAALLLAKGADVRAPGTEFYEGLGPRHKHPVRDFLAEVVAGAVLDSIAGSATDQSPAGVGASPRERSAGSLPTIAGPYFHPAGAPVGDTTDGLDEIWGDGTWVYRDGTEAHWDKRTIRGITPLHLAAASGSLELAKVLLAAGADPKAKDSEGQTPRDAAIAHGHPELADALQSPR